MIFEIIHNYSMFSSELNNVFFDYAIKNVYKLIKNVYRGW